MYSKMKLFGHPMHAMMVSYPIALYTSTLVAFIIFAVSKDTIWFKAAVAANVAGVVMAFIAAGPGFIDWVFGIPDGTEAKRNGLIHMLFNSAALILFLVNALIHVGRWNNASPDGQWWGIVLAALGVLCTIVAGLYGWTLVQDNHVGIKLTPEQERTEISGGGA